MNNGVKKSFKPFISSYYFSKDSLKVMYAFLEKVVRVMPRDFIEDEALAHIKMLIKERIKNYDE